MCVGDVSRNVKRAVRQAVAVHKDSVLNVSQWSQDESGVAGLRGKFGD